MRREQGRKNLVEIVDTNRTLIKNSIFFLLKNFSEINQKTPHNETMKKWRERIEPQTHTEKQKEFFISIKNS